MTGDGLPITVPIINRTSLKPGQPRYDALLADIDWQVRRFLQWNPARSETTRVRILHAGHGLYKARAEYISDQGTSHIATAFSEKEDWK